MDLTPSGTSATRSTPAARKARARTNMPASPRRTHRIRAGVLTVLGALAVLCLSVFQFGDRNDLNGMPFAQARPLASDLEKAKILAKQGNIDLLAGETGPGEGGTS